MVSSGQQMKYRIGIHAPNGIGTVDCCRRTQSSRTRYIKETSRKAREASGMLASRRVPVLHLACLTRANVLPLMSDTVKRNCSTP